LLKALPKATGGQIGGRKRIDGSRVGTIYSGTADARRPRPRQEDVGRRAAARLAPCRRVALRARRRKQA